MSKLEEAHKFINNCLITTNIGHSKEVVITKANAKIATKIASQPEWIKCSEKMPNPEKTVLAYGLNEYNHKRIVRAFYVPEFYVSDEDIEFSGDCDYNEEKDEYFHPKGWYEHNESEEIHWKLSFEITDWKCLPDYPCSR